MKIIRKLIQTLLSIRGYQVVYYGKGRSAPPDPLSAFFRALSSLGFSPRHILDVGANRGTWTRTALRHFPEAHYTLLEPQERFHERVRDLEQAGKVTWINAGAGDKRDRLRLNVPVCDTSASFVSIEQTGHIPVDTIDVDVVTLDEAVAASPHGIPEMVKIDAEGFDLRVIQGARSLHGKTDVFLIEMAVFDPKAENTLMAALRLMDSIGYAALDVTDLNRCATSGILWLVEIPFLRKDSPLWAKIPAYVASFEPD